MIQAGGGAWHQSVGESASLCGVPGVEEVPLWSERTAYTWVNEDGVRSFGDNAPSSASAQTFGMDEGDRDFTLSLRWEGVSPNRTFEGRIRAGAMRIYDQWGEWIGYDALVRSRITLRITSNRDAFLRDWGGDPGGPIPNGFYSLIRNEAVIFYDSARTSEAKLLQVAFHELAHLISTWQVGSLPTWYGEGIAEYFETMDVEWQSAQFRSADAWRQRVARDGAMGLSELLALNAAEWFSGNIGQRYATAGALVTFMTTTDAGRAALTDLAQQAHAVRCKKRSAKQGLTPSEYPGGVVRLERDFRRWLEQSPNH
ncbi:hypothetical protein [Congregibacter litoralis]|uniref:hypothetical protein n=1 Tax=Congregibacter litoralis TaxID=393662 RepID=UPI00006B9D88|nr:hypothetical protein [Congregibacter litoralis]